MPFHHEIYHWKYVNNELNVNHNLPSEFDQILLYVPKKPTGPFHITSNLPSRQIYHIQLWDPNHWFCQIVPSLPPLQIIRLCPEQTASVLLDLVWSTCLHSNQPLYFCRDLTYLAPSRRTCPPPHQMHTLSHIQKSLILFIQFGRKYSILYLYFSYCMMNFRLLEIFKAYISFIGIIRVYVFIGYSLKINNYNYACFARYSSFLILKIYLSHWNTLSILLDLNMIFIDAYINTIYACYFILVILIWFCLTFTLVLN